MDSVSSHVNFFDCGPLHGEEIQMFIDQCDYPYTVYSFEAHKPFADNVRDRYKNNHNVHVYHYAIGNKDKLYLADNEGEGNSIYATKRNVGTEYVSTNPLTLSTWIKENVPTFNQDINILRYNIEGAEWDLMHDITKHNLRFHAYLSGEDDIPKVGELKEKFPEYKQLLHKHHINPQPFSKVRGDNVNIKQLLCELQSIQQ